MSTRMSRSSLKRSVNSQEITPLSKRSKPDPKKSPSQSNTTTTEDGSGPSCDTENNSAMTPQESSEPDDTNASSATTSKSLTLPESTGDIFAAPSRTLLIHACNTEGSWGAGIAKAFKDKYPKAYTVYHKHCLQHGSKLHSTAFLIPPQKSDGSDHFIGCLFTSCSKGRKKDPPGKILDATGPAMRDLLMKVREWDEKHGEEESVGEVRMCKINSGLFGVPWEKTKAVVGEIEVTENSVREVKVLSREE